MSSNGFSFQSDILTTDDFVFSEKDDFVFSEKNDFVFTENRIIINKSHINTATNMNGNVNGSEESVSIVTSKYFNMKENVKMSYDQYRLIQNVDEYKNGLRQHICDPQNKGIKQNINFIVQNNNSTVQNNNIEQNNYTIPNNITENIYVEQNTSIQNNYSVSNNYTVQSNSNNHNCTKQFVYKTISGINTKKINKKSSIMGQNKQNRRKNSICMLFSSEMSDEHETNRDYNRTQNNCCKNDNYYKNVEVDQNKENNIDKEHNKIIEEKIQEKECNIDDQMLKKEQNKNIKFIHDKNIRFIGDIFDSSFFVTESYQMKNGKNWYSLDENVNLDKVRELSITETNKCFSYDCADKHPKEDDQIPLHNEIVSQNAIKSHNEVRLQNDQTTLHNEIVSQNDQAILHHESILQNEIVSQNDKTIVRKENVLINNSIDYNDSTKYRAVYHISTGHTEIAYKDNKQQNKDTIQNDYIQQNECIIKKEHTDQQNDDNNLHDDNKLHDENTLQWNNYTELQRNNYTELQRNNIEQKNENKNNNKNENKNDEKKEIKKSYLNILEEKPFSHHWTKKRKSNLRVHSVPLPKRIQNTEDPFKNYYNPIETHHTLPILGQGPSDSLLRINVTTVKEMIQSTDPDSFSVIDCRFEYEFEGGHIQGAININDTVMMDRFYNRNKGKILVFHCEYSSIRAPRMAKYLRNKDRNENVYPELDFRDVYIMDGGYKVFYEMFPEMCTPCRYVSMDDKGAVTDDCTNCTNYINDYNNCTNYINDYNNIDCTNNDCTNNDCTNEYSTCTDGVLKRVKKE